MSFSFLNIQKKILPRFIVCLLVLLSSLTAFSQEDTGTVNSTDTDSASQFTDGENGGEEKLTKEKKPDSVIFRSVPDTLVSRLQKEKAFEYANDPEYWVKDPPPKPTKGFWYYLGQLLTNRPLRIFVYLLLFALLLWVLFKVIVTNNLFLFSFYKKRKGWVDEEAGETELDKQTIEEKIRNYIGDKNHRMATRYLYLRTLQQLDTRGWIRYHAESTNNDYLKQMSQYAMLGDFRFLTQVYEYVWYGEFVVSDHQFSIIHDRFNDFYLKTGA